MNPEILTPELLDGSFTFIEQSAKAAQSADPQGPPEAGWTDATLSVKTLLYALGGMIALFILPPLLRSIKTLTAPAGSLLNATLGGVGKLTQTHTAGLMAAGAAFAAPLVGNSGAMEGIDQASYALYGLAGMFGLYSALSFSRSVKKARQQDTPQLTVAETEDLRSVRNAFDSRISEAEHARLQKSVDRMIGTYGAS